MAPKANQRFWCGCANMRRQNFGVRVGASNDKQNKELSEKGPLHLRQ